MPKVAEAHLTARREQIIEAAHACFARKGFHRTTMQDICAQAELSPGAVYRYFAGKEDIITASCQREEERTQAFFGQSAGAIDARDALSRLAGVFFGELALPGAVEAARASVNIWAEGVVNTEVGAQQREGLVSALNFLTGFVRDAQGRGEFDPALPAEAVARVIVSLYKGLLLQQALDPAIDVAAYSRAALAILTCSLWTDTASSSRE